MNFNFNTRNISMSDSRPITDINSLQLEDDDLIIDPTADPDGRQVPPDGKYIVKLGMNESGNGAAWITGVDKRGRSYIMGNFVGTIVADGSPFNNAKVFDSRSTLVLDSSGTCGLMAIPRALKVNVPARTTKTGLVQLVRQHLAGEPLVAVEIQWQSRYQDENGVWKTFKKGMRNYPERLDVDGRPTGQHIPEAEAPDGQMYPARAVIIRYMPAEEAR